MGVFNTIKISVLELQRIPMKFIEIYLLEISCLFCNLECKGYSSVVNNVEIKRKMKEKEEEDKNKEEMKWIRKTKSKEF